MDTVNLATLNSSSFVFSRDLSPWADVLPLTSGKFRAHMRLSVTDPVVYYEWSSDNRRAAYSQTKANGQLTFASNPISGDTIELGFSSVILTSLIGSSLPLTLTALVAYLNASTDPQISLASYSASGSGILNIVYVNAGTVGNLFTIGASSNNVTASGTTLKSGGGMITLTAPISDICNFLGDFVYDCRFESSDGMSVVYLFGGTITFSQGVTRSGDANMATLQLGPSVQIATLPTPIGDGELILCSDCGGGPTVLESSRGVWTRLNEGSFFSRADSFGSVTFTVLKNANIQLYTSTLIGNLVISLSSVNTYPGAFFRVIAPQNLGGFTFTIQGQALTSGQYASYLWTGTAWQISGLGSY